jgi:hypothetical protein
MSEWLSNPPPYLRAAMDRLMGRKPKPRKAKLPKHHRASLRFLSAKPRSAELPPSVEIVELDAYDQ